MARVHSALGGRFGGRFQLGQVVATPGALQALEDSGQAAIEFLRRHLSCDWGEVSPEDAEANNRALTEGTRLFSVYQTAKGIRLWVITEADRSATTLLLPDEY